MGAPFFGLANRTQCSPPGPIDCGHLMQAGLGGKSLSLVETSDAEIRNYAQEEGMNFSAQTSETIVLWM